MNLPRLTRGAVEDAEAATVRFRKISPSLADAFLDELALSLEQIQLAPRQSARLETSETVREIRRVLIVRFNYLVIYEMMGDLPHVLAVMHASQQPDAWRSRLHDKLI